MKLFTLLILVIFFFSFQVQASHAFLEKVDGLEYVVRKIEDAPLDRFISKRFDLYELYYENRSDKTFSIPGYSIDFGVNYAGLSEVLSFSKDKTSKKFAVFNLATSAASIALGGFAKSAANTAIRMGSFRKNNSTLSNEKGFLSSSRTYIIYPNDSLSLFFFLDKFANEPPTLVRYICHDEVQNINNIVINENLDVRGTINAENDSPTDTPVNNLPENVIAVPASNQYK